MANAIEGMGTIAAPLLAGFSLTLIALVIDNVRTYAGQTTRCCAWRSPSCC
jgi:hypothetical protein